MAKVSSAFLRREFRLSKVQADKLRDALERLAMAGHRGGVHYSHLVGERWDKWVKPALESLGWEAEFDGGDVLFERDGDAVDCRAVWNTGDSYVEGLWILHGVGAFWASLGDLVERYEGRGYEVSDNWLHTGSAR